MNCKICKSKEITFYNKFDFFEVYKCKACSNMFAGTFPDSKRMKKIYNEDYYNAWKANKKNIPKSVEKMKKKTFTSYLNFISKYTNLKNKKLLDIGCATGYLLESAKEKGCDCWGLELNPYGAKESSKKFPNKIDKGLLENAKYKSQFFDIVIMIDLIEHTQSPISVLKEVKKIIKKGGYVLIVTPDIESWWAKVLGKKWTNFKEEHIYYFGHRSFKNLITSLGFKCIFSTSVYKHLTIRYIYGQLTVFKTPFLSPISKFFFNLCPDFLRDYPFPIITGDFLILAKRE